MSDQLTPASGSSDPSRRLVDVVVVGGGAAGLQIALTLGRARRRILIVDAGHQRNLPANGVHNVLGLEGTPPADLLARGHAELAEYDVHIVADSVVSARRISSTMFEVALAGGATVECRRIAVATGLVDDLPDIPGLRKRWGREVFHCPFCHGWEVRDQRLVVLGLNHFATHLALTLTTLTSSVTLVTHAASPTEEQRAQLSTAGVRLISGEAAEVLVTANQVSGIRLAEGDIVPADAIAVTPAARPRLEGLESLGLRTAAHPTGLGFHLPADPRGLTEVPGVFAAGNVTEPSATVAHAIAAGLTVAASVNTDLLQEDTVPTTHGP